MAKINTDPSAGGRQCPEGLIRTYAKYTENSEASSDFHVWTCLALVASALGRNVYFPRGDWQLYPNLYMILIGESGLGRKSTTLRLGSKMLRKAMGEDINILSEKTTPEYMIDTMSKLSEEKGHAVVCMHASELSVLLGKTKLDDSFIKILTDLYDNPDDWSYGTIARGENKCKNVSITILGGSTPEWLKNSLPSDSLGGGFFSRLILVDRPPSGARIANPEDNVSDEDRIRFQNSIVHDIKIISRLKGRMYWTPEAKDMWTNWYESEEYSVPEDIPPFMRGYYGRKGDMLIKISMCTSASLRDNLEVHPEDFMFALELMNDNEEHLEHMISTMDMSESGRDIDHVFGIIEKYTRKEGEITRSHLMRLCSYKFNAWKLDTIVDSLKEQDRIEERMNPLKKRTPRTYRVKTDRDRHLEESDSNVHNQFDTV